MIDKKKILKNIATLSVSEIVNKGVVLITSLYLMRQVTPEGTGIINFGDSFSSFFMFLVILAFYQIGSREIAKRTFDTAKIVNTILTLRVILAGFAAIVYVAVLYNLNIDAETKSVTYVYMILLLTNALNLDWAFQGMERMGVMATRQVLTSSLTLAGFLIFVHGRDDVISAALITALSGLLNVLMLLAYYHKRENKFRFEINREVLQLILKSILPLSIFIFSVTLLNRANILIMEFYDISKTDMGIFVGAYKFITFGVVPSNIIQMSFFQLLARTNDKTERLTVYNKYFTMNLLVGSFVFMMLYLFPEVIILALKQEYAASIPLLKVFVISGLIMYMNTSVTPALIAWNHERKVMNATIIGSIASLAANFILIRYYGIEGAVYASIIGEAFVFLVYARNLYQLIQYNFVQSIARVFSVLFVSVLVGILLKYLGLNIFLILAIVPIVFYFMATFLKIINIKELIGIVKR